MDTLEIVFEKGVSISCTEKDDLVYVFSEVVDSSETAVMQIRLKEKVPSKWIFSPFPCHFMEFIFRWTAIKHCCYLNVIKSCVSFFILLSIPTLYM